MSWNASGTGRNMQPGSPDASNTPATDMPKPCPYCHGEPPSTDGYTECGWCHDGYLRHREWWMQ